MFDWSKQKSLKSSFTSGEFLQDWAVLFFVVVIAVVESSLLAPENTSCYKQIAIGQGVVVRGQNSAYTNPKKG